MRRAGRAIVVEGYLDAIRLALAGIEEVVAPLGTALTEEQAALLMRYAREVFLLYDSDEAGQVATFRSGLELLRHKAAVRVVSLPAGDDPDTFVRAHGRAGLETQLSQAIDLLDRQIQLIERLGWFTDLRRQRLAIDRLLPTIRAARDPLTRDLYLSRIAEVTHLDKATIASEADEPPMSAGGGSSRASVEVDPNEPPSHAAPPPDYPSETATAPARRPWVPRRGKPAPPEWQSTSAPLRARRDEPDERTLVQAMLASRDLVERIAERHAPSDFRDPNYAAIFAALLASGHADGLDDVAESLSADALRVLRELTDSQQSHAAEGSDISLILTRFGARRLEARIAEIRSIMSTVHPEEQNVLLGELRELQKELGRLLPIRSPRSNRKG